MQRPHPRASDLCSPLPVMVELRQRKPVAMHNEACDAVKKHPLAGIRVLDLGSVAMAPYAGQWLGDLGADVIKVEPPGGDITRKVGPTTLPGMGALFLGLNRNKRSIVLDLKTVAGKAALIRLSETVDVVIHNNRQHKMDALGLGADVLLRQNPRLIYASFQGFGKGGSYSRRLAYDDVIQSMCGLASIMANGNGPPRYVPTVLADKTTGLMGTIAILAALNRRAVTGEGGLVEIPMFESMVSFTAAEHLYGRQFDPPQGDAIYPRAAAAGRRPYKTTNGYLCVLPYSDRQWRDFLRGAGRPDLAIDARFCEMETRAQHIDALYEILADILLTNTTQHWIELCSAHQIAFAPVLSLDELIEDVHLVETGYFEEFDVPRLGKIRAPGVPLRFSGERPSMAPPPLLGEHGREILAEAGFSNDEIANILT
jgi:crotonobetainyl-CoA:carnitine CoA-transferase CaiB-like acyl-CoA transferase